jgi:RNA polymerase sigma factor (sigma-70 family)
MELKDTLQVAIDVGVRFGIRIVGAIALWIIGRALIGFCGRLMGRWLTKEHVDATLGRYIGSAMSIVGEESRAQEATDTLYADLYGLEERNGRRRSLFAYYHARSSLASWLRSVVARNLIDGYRAERRSQALKARIARQPGGAEGVTPAPADPDRVRHLGMLRQALAAALSGLGPRERLRLAYYHVQELPLAQVGKLLGEHESTASRKLDQTRRQLRAEVERRLHADHGLSEEDVQACYEAALDEWPFEVTRDLAGGQ